MKPTRSTSPDPASANDAPDVTRTSALLDSELRDLLADAEGAVAQLRAELTRREEFARNATDDTTGVDLEAQHAEINRLREHLAQAKVRWADVREFFVMVIEELRQGDPRPKERERGDHE